MGNCLQEALQQEVLSWQGYLQNKDSSQSSVREVANQWDSCDMDKAGICKTEDNDKNNVSILKLLQPGIYYGQITIKSYRQSIHQ